MTMLAALVDYYDRLAANGQASQPGYAPAKVGFEIVLRPDGAAELADLRSVESGKRRPRIVEAPEIARTSGVRPAFLWDKTAYVLGVVADKGEGGVRPTQGKRTQEEHDAFKAFHGEALAGTTDEGLLAFLCFLRAWRPNEFEQRGWTAEALDTNIVFRLDGDRDAEGQRRFLHQRPEARRLWAALDAPSAKSGVCLVRGELAPIAAVHPMIKGVQDAQSSGAAIVSFNAPAFTSYGKEQGANAPISERATFSYTTALNALLANPRRRVRIGNATTVFWADATEAPEQAAAAAEDLFAAVWDPKADDPDFADFQQMRAAMESIADGRGWERAPALDPRTRMHVLGLSPNNARLAVRFWHVGSFGELARNLVAHFDDMAIEPKAFQRPPKMGAWLFETAVQRKAENIPPLLGGEFARAILTGQRYPRTLLSAVVQRIRADGAVNGPRAALCRAVIQRDLRINKSKENIPVGLDKDNANPAYRLGRLFALYEWAEESAENRNATLRDKYFAAAAATPARVFPLLMRGSTHNLSKLRKGGKAGLAVVIDREIGEVMSGLPDPLPRAFALEEQGRFVTGYYHQERERFTSKKHDSGAPQAEQETKAS